ncbi:MAG: recombinase family protein [Pseudomonadota bacterium]
MSKQQEKPEKTSAIIYCRVSSTKQKTQGGGLESQAQRCRDYAASKGYDVEMVFSDDISGGGDFMKRPGMRAVLAFLDAQPEKNYVVIFDDLKRLARDTRFHWELRSELAERGASVDSPNFKFEDTPEGEFIETIIAAQGELERKQNRRQVIQKMRARVEAGYWVFRAPIGYKYINAKGGGGKVLVLDEPLASTVRQALEGFASDYFVSQAEVQRFLEADAHFPKDRSDGSIRMSSVNRLLRKVVYAGCVEAPSWDIDVRKGMHDALISFETHERIIEKLDGRKRPGLRKNTSADFPLRGHVVCGCCGNHMTGAWSKGRTKHYAYYRCETRGCEAKGKSVRRDDMEGGLIEILKGLQPTKRLYALAEAIFKDAWIKRARHAHDDKAAFKQQ